ncbi:hypothetical protein CMI42_02865 [Candidatus Pacearchaeota archaeon]|nr:hypothetical protein [Candidatus Pacearchaeota archaeon]
MKFAHITDCHLGGWRQEELQKLNMEYFREAINSSIEEEVDFVLFTGDLFDSAFPPIDVLKDTFFEFRKLKEKGVKCYVIAGSHDYSVSGKTFLDVLEMAGFCEIAKYEENEEEVVLNPLNYESVHIYGYPGKKSGLEVDSIRKIKIKEPYENNFRILMLHTTLTEVAEGLPIESVALSELPKADYYAMGHIHVDYEHENDGKPVIYGGPTFPNNFKELEDLGGGCFYIVEVNGFTKVTKKEIKLKEIISINVEIDNSIVANQRIISEIDKRDVNGKIVLLRVYGIITEGKTSDIDFRFIENHVRSSGAYSFLKNTSKLEMAKQGIEIVTQEKDMDKMEGLIIDRYGKENPSDFNNIIVQLIEVLNSGKQEDEKSAIFEDRLFDELENVLKVELKG